MRRRAFLGWVPVLAGAVTAGCRDADETVARLALRRATPERLAAVTAIGPFDGDGAAADGRPNGTAVRRFVDAAPVRGTASGNVSLPTEAFERPVYDGETVYDFSATEVANRSYVAYTLHVSYDLVGDPGRSPRYADLPAIDRRALDEAFPVPASIRERMREEGLTPGVGDGDTTGRYGVDVRVRYDRAERNRSRLVAPPADTVRYDGTRFGLVVGREDEERVPVYEYAVADSRPVAAYARELKARYLVRLDDLPAAERAVLDAAVEAPYDVTPSSDAAWSLHDRLEDDGTFPVARGDRPPLVTPAATRRHWLVRYDGTDYLLAWHERPGPSGLG